MTVYVLTNGDYPRAVFSVFVRAKRVRDDNNANDRKRLNDNLAGYWRVHTFTLDDESSALTSPTP